MRSCSEFNPATEVFLTSALVRGFVQEADTNLECGHELTVYITDKQSKSGRVTVALEPSSLPRQSWEDIVADGQTPYSGIVRRILESGVLVDIGYDSFCFLPNSQMHSNQSFSVGQQLTVYAVQKRISTGKVSLSVERRGRPLEPLEDVSCDGRSPYRGIVRSINEFGLFVDFGCSVVGLLDEDYDDPSLIQKQSSLKPGDVITVYPICKDLNNGRVYLSLKKRDVPIASVWDLAADGQTPYSARVVSVHGKDCTMDLGADTRGLLMRSYAAVEGLKKLEIGDITHVYIHRRNSTSGSLTLSLVPSTVRKISLRETLRELEGNPLKVYDGQVYCIQHGHIFLDLGLEVGAVMPGTAPLPFACQVGDRVCVRITYLDKRRGRFCAIPAPAETQASQGGESRPGSPDTSLQVQGSPAPTTEASEGVEALSTLEEAQHPAGDPGASMPLLAAEPEDAKRASSRPQELAVDLLMPMPRVGFRKLCKRPRSRLGLASLTWVAAFLPVAYRLFLAIGSRAKVL